MTPWGALISRGWNGFEAGAEEEKYKCGKDWGWLF